MERISSWLTVGRRTSIQEITLQKGRKRWIWMETMDFWSTDGDSYPARSQRRHGNARRYGKNLSETPTDLLLAH